MKIMIWILSKIADLHEINELLNDIDCISRTF